jgi:glyoxylase-like metal-dependent hydrolase (beta-lactamase superfamily II)
MKKVATSTLFALLLQFCFAIMPAWAVATTPTPESAGLKVEALGNGVYAVIGMTGGRTYENFGMNANFGFIDTPEGVILIDSGASSAGAALLDALVHRSTGHAVCWVVNTGSQDHRWLGNGYFAARGAKIIALQRTVATQTRLGAQQLELLRPLLRERLDGTTAFTAPSPIVADEATLKLGGVTLAMNYLADAHFPGDIIVRLPDRGIMFSGDHIYTRRILGILGESDAASWLSAFRKIEALAPSRIVPGHGPVSTLQDARRDTGDYLAFIVDGVRKYAEELAGVDTAVSALANAPQFSRLENFDTLHRTNLSNAYLRQESK